MRRTSAFRGGGERGWPAEIAVRAAGLALLAICAAAATALHRAVHQPAHAIGAIDFALAALTVLAWGSGWAALAEGHRLFEPVPIARHA